MTAAPATVSTVAAHFQIKFGGMSAKNYRKHWPVLRLLRKVRGVADKADHPVEFKRGDSAGSSFHTVGGAFPDSNHVKRDTGYWAWSEVAQTFGANDLVRGISRANRLPTDSTLMGSEGHGALVSIYDDEETYFFTGDYTASPPEFAGLTAAGGTAAFGGINPATTGYEAWQGKNASAALADFNIDPLSVLRNGILGPIYEEGGSGLYAFARIGLINKIADFTNAQRIEEVPLPSGVAVNVAHLGAMAFKVDKTYFIENPNAPANKVAVVSPESIALQYVDQADEYVFPRMDEIVRELARFGLDVQPSAVEELFLNGAYELPPLYFKPLHQNATKNEVGVAGQHQVVYGRRDVHGILTLS